MIASGIGITPFVSMVRELVQSGHDLSGLTIAHVLRDQRRAVHADDLESARAANARIATVEAPELADGIDDPARLAELIGPSAAGAHYYVSGTPAFVERTSAAVRRLDGTARSRPWRVHTDSFSGY